MACSIRLWAFLVAACFCRTAVAQSVYHDSERHWSATPPPGWVPMPAPLVDRFNAEFEERTHAKPKFRYIAGYLKSLDPESVYPYILIQHTAAPLSGASYEDLERELGGAAQQSRVTTAEALKDVVSDLQAGLQKLDRGKNRVYLSIQADVAPSGRMKAICVGFLGRDGIVQFNCYSKAWEFEKDLPTYERFIDSFSYDAGYAFVPRSPIWHGILTKAAIGALIGALLGAVHYFRRKKATG
jgi:hypothetical protein